MQEASDFFSSGKHSMLLVDIKPKLNREDEKRLRLDFSMPLTADILAQAPQAVQDAFYAISKDGHTLNPIGVVREYQGAKVKFYATRLTAASEIAIEECTLRQLEVKRPKNKVELADGDVTLKFHINAPASRKLWNYTYENYGATIFATFEDAQPLLPNIKSSSEVADDGQANLNLAAATDGKAAASGDKEEKAEEPETPAAKKKSTPKKKSKKH